MNRPWTAGPVPVNRIPLGQVREFMDANWRQPGFTCPNNETYPWLWLWDSCFHSLIWAVLGEQERAISELRAALAHQHPSGFVPHIVYYDGFAGHRRFWGMRSTSSITQPPIYGHAVAVLTRWGIGVPEEIVDRARRGLEFLLQQRRRTTRGLVEMVHPWESGCDHSPRWDDLFTSRSGELDPNRVDPFERTLWYERKGELVESVIRRDGAPIGNDQCRVGSVAFNALIAFCAAELADVTGDPMLAASADELVLALTQQWDPESLTWVDDGPTRAGSGSARTLEALLPLLVDERSEVVELVVHQLVAPDAFAGPFGLRQVHPEEPTFDPTSYWRGASWPQLNYLFELALRIKGFDNEADQVALTSGRGALVSGFSEYWNASDGTGGGARPQSWAGLTVINQSWMNEI